MTLSEFLFGRLTWEAFVHDAVETAAVLSTVFGAIVVGALLTYYKKWGWLWREWLTSLDPKKIGVMYIVVSFIMFLKGVADAAMMRAQQAWSIGETFGYLSADHFQQIFSAHGTTMIFFVAMGFVFGLLNLVVPLQIGARDLAFPFLNSISFWLFAAGSSFIFVSLILGDFSIAGWVAYPPLSGLAYSPGEGIDYWIWSVQISGVGSLLSGINFVVTILKMRAPGMTLMKMPIFTWCALATSILVIFAFPILTATLAMLSTDRLLGTCLFTTEFGGNPMMYVNFIWAWGHPEVYILILPAFGIYSEVVATFSQKRLFGYPSMVWAVMAITFLSFVVWLHHFFTMGASPGVNAFFGIMTMLISIPTGVKIFNWLFTMYRGKVLFTTPMLWFLGFIFIFTTGGMTGVLMSIAPVDFQMHNSLFLVAHFHSMVIGGVLFGIFAGVSYWFPKFTGLLLNERIGKWAFTAWMVGFCLAFFPLYVLGLKGVTRRLDHYQGGMGWDPLLQVAFVGVLFILLGVALQVLQLLVSLKEGRKDLTGDPWNGRTLEWSTSSPPPFYNFAVIPTVKERDAFWEMKERPEAKPTHYEPIHLPKHSAMGIYASLFGFFLCFALIWHIVWLGAVGFVGMIASLIARLSEEGEVIVSSETIQAIEQGRGR